MVDLYLDLVTDLTLHPLYNQRSVVQGPRDGRPRGRSLPLHRLDMNLPEDLNLEADSMAPSEMGREAGGEMGRNPNGNLPEQTINMVSCSLYIQVKYFVLGSTCFDPILLL